MPHIVLRKPQRSGNILQLETPGKDLETVSSNSSQKNMPIMIKIKMTNICLGSGSIEDLSSPTLPVSPLVERIFAPMLIGRELALDLGLFHCNCFSTRKASDASTISRRWLNKHGSFYVQTTWESFNMLG